MALMLAGAVVEGIDGIMERGGRERLGCAYFKAFAGMVELTPVADVGLVAGFLRTDVGVELVGHLLAVYAEVGALIAVGVVFAGAAAVELDSVKILGHGHLHAEAEQM